MIRLGGILKNWIKNNPKLKHFKIYTSADWEYWQRGWPGILQADDVNVFVGTKCDGIAVALGVMDDYVYYRNTANSSKIKFMAGDPQFFEKVEADLIKFHKKIKCADMV